VRSAWFAPLEREVTRIVLGTATFIDLPAEASYELLDAWLECGGNVIDTARHYGGAEEIIGRWFRERGCRDDVVLCTKGGHYDVRTGRSRVNTTEIAADLDGSLAALGVESVDLYILHRDDPAQPVGPIIEEFNAYRADGRFGTFGASNWTESRLGEAQSYAAAHGLESFSCSSPQLSLAVPAVEPWPGCVSIHSSASLDWYSRTQLSVFAWSSQARGFFAGRTDEYVEQVYATNENEERRRRASLLASRVGCTPAQMALAWVLAQPFPTYAVVGPETVAELEESVAALEIELTPDDVAWLDLEVESE
jgi:aryl-alcohol dehydrogenase-like predicted oxidoreductase